MNNLLKSILLSTFCVLIILWIHWLNQSMLFDEVGKVFDERVATVIKFHEEFEVFAKRPIVTFLVNQFLSIFSVSIGIAFMVVNSIFLMLSGVVLFHLSLLHHSSSKQAVANTIFYFASFTILFAYFDPIYSYDEPLQYLLIFSAFICYLKKQLLPFIACMSLAIIVRESSMILLPAIFLFVDGKIELSKLFEKKSIQKGLILLIPVAMYFAFILWYVPFAEIQESGKTGIDDRVENFNKNFADQLTAIESLVSFFLAIGLVTYFFLMKSRKNNPGEKLIEDAFILTFLLNSTVVFMFTFAREARLFTFPLIFVWPYFAGMFKEQLRIFVDIKLLKKAFTNWKFVGVLGFMTLINNQIAHKTFYSLYYLEGANYFADYFFITLSLISFHFLLTRFKARQAPGVVLE